MTEVVKFCVLNYFGEKELFFVSREAVNREPITEGDEPARCRRVIRVNGIELYYFLKEITFWSNLRCNLLRTERIRKYIPVFKVVPPDREPLDYKW